MWSNLKNDFYFFRYLWKFSKSYVISQALISIINGLLPLVYIVIPRLIIDELVLGSNFDAILRYIIIYTAIQLAGSVIIAYLNEKYVNLNGHLYSMHFLLLINEKAVSLDMEQLD